MDFNWFFRGFRNYPRNKFPDESGNFEGDPQFKGEGTKDSNDILIDPFENFGGTSHDIFQQMDAMLDRFFSGNLSSFGSEDFFENVPNNTNPRAIMLKEPGCKNCKPKIEEPSNKENKRSLMMIDSDIDENVSKHGLILDAESRNKVVHNFSFKRSIKSMRLPDGTMEEHQTFTDSDGNTTTTVRRFIGDQSYEVTTHSDNLGLKEKKENFINLDQNELHEFEERWQSIKDNNMKLPTLDMQPKAHVPILNPPPGDASYSSLFKKFFGI